MLRASDPTSAMAASTSPASSRSATEAAAESWPGRAARLTRDPEAEEPLLGALVDLALDPSPLVVGAGRDSRPRIVYLAQEEIGVRREAVALEHQPGGGRNGVAEHALVSERRVVDQAADDAVAVARSR